MTTNSGLTKALARTEPPTRRLGDLLVSRGVVTADQVSQALELQKQFGGRLGTNLEEMGFVTGEQLALCLSEQLGLPFRGAEAVASLSEELLRRVAPDVARRFRCVPLSVQGNTLCLGISDHGVLDQVLALQMAIGAELEFALLTELTLNYALDRYYGIRRELRGLRLNQVAQAYRWLSQASRALAACNSYDEIVTRLTQLLAERFPVRSIRVLPLPPELAQRFAGSNSPFFADDTAWCAIRDATSCRAALALKGLQPAYGDLELIAALLESAAISIGQVETKAALAKGARLNQYLRRYVPGRVVDEMSRDEDLVVFGRKHDITVMFADIRGFTALAEQLDPDLMVQILSVFFVEMSVAVDAAGGTLDKFIGDAVMAFWGAPKPTSDHAQHAMHAAAAMQSCMPRVNRKIRRMHVSLPHPLAIGIGVATGSALVGNIGTARLTQYTAIGDVVNVAARLCGQAGGGEILIDHRTTIDMPAELRCESQGPVKLKGRDEPVQVYRVTRGPLAH